MAAVCLRNSGSWQPEVGGHGARLTAAVAAVPGLADGVTPFGRQETPRSWVAMVAVAAIRYRSHPQN